MLEADREYNAELEAAAWRAAECSRARALSEAVELSRFAHPGAADSELWELYRRINRQINAESLRLARGGTDAEDRRKRLGGLQQEMIGIVNPDGPTLAEVQRELLDRDTALLEYSLGETGGYLWVVRAGSLAAYRLPARRVIEAHARHLVAAMQYAGVSERDAAARSFSQAAAALAACIIAPALPDLQARRLLIVPDGALQLVPFAALPLSGGRPLIEKYEVVSIPSAATLLAIRRRPNSVPTRGVAVIADPVFDSGNTRVIRGRGSRDAAGPPRFSRLPFSHREALSIASLFPQPEVTLLLRFEAAREALTSGRLRDRRILHTATHAVSTAGTLYRPALVFSLVNPDGSSRPGFLSDEEISSLALNADLVVLSACQSAAGLQVPGEGFWA